MDIEKEREEFSRWVLTHPDNLDITSYEENIMFDAWQAAKAQAIPGGFVLVPKEPSLKVLDRLFVEHLFDEDRAAYIYRDIIDAQEQNHESK